MSDPHVVIHVAVSLDGATTGFEADVARFYELAATWREDITLVGADTILAQEQVLTTGGGPGPAADGPLLAVVDGLERIPDWMWPALRAAGHWRDAKALRAGPGAHVDLAAELAALDAAVVRVDSGGALNGALLHAGLVNELSLLVHPCLVGDGPRWYGDAPPPLTLEPLPGGAPDWLRYRVAG